ncbi:MAG: polysaccharide deacetylase family protein [Solobacterium sp.]|nr:polysaccharide deacetylase family protein [Solobacterium sp.]
MTNTTPKRRKKRRRLRKTPVIAFFILLAMLTVTLLNRWEVVISVNGEKTVHTEAGQPYEDKGAKAKLRGTIFRFLTKDIDMEVTNEVDTGKLGEYKVRYSASDEKHSGEAFRTVVVEDTTPPEIILKEDENAYTLPGHEYEEIGFEARDACDGDLTEQTKTEVKDDTVYYTVTDSSGNTAKAERKIVYDDRTAPEITLEGGADVIWYNDSPYADNFKAEDDLDGDVTSKVVVEGKVDTSKNGDYELVYKVTDSYGNEAQATRYVHVTDRPPNAAEPDNAKVIYLTFDDGPYQYTDELLDILKKYNVKATFFTTACYGYKECIRREYEEGHTVAIHTYTHDYAKIYSSTEAFWADLEAQNDLIEEMTGHRTNLFRFPGGSSNTISANYCPGIMTELVRQAAEKGYEYFDWNVTSGDSGETTVTEVVLENVKTIVSQNAEYGAKSIVLQHDIKSFSVAAVEDIIKWGLENGYMFLPLNANSPKSHHGINN